MLMTKDPMFVNLLIIGISALMACIVALALVINKKQSDKK